MSMTSQRRGQDTERCAEYIKVLFCKIGETSVFIQNLKVCKQTQPPSTEMYPCWNISTHMDTHNVFNSYLQAINWHICILCSYNISFHVLIIMAFTKFIKLSVARKEIRIQWITVTFSCQHVTIQYEKQCAYAYGMSSIMWILLGLTHFI